MKGHGVKKGKFKQAEQLNKLKEEAAAKPQTVGEVAAKQSMIGSTLLGGPGVVAKGGVMMKVVQKGGVKIRTTAAEDPKKARAEDPKKARAAGNRKPKAAEKSGKKG